MLSYQGSLFKRLVFGPAGNRHEDKENKKVNERR